MKCFNILLGSKTTVHRLQREEPHQPFPPEEEEEEELFQPSANARAALTPRKVPGSDNPLKLNTSRNFSAACANEPLQIQQFPRCPLSLLLPAAVRAGQERESLPVPRAAQGELAHPSCLPPPGTDHTAPGCRGRWSSRTAVKLGVPEAHDTPRVRSRQSTPEVIFQRRRTRTPPVTAADALPGHLPPRMLEPARARPRRCLWGLVNQSRGIYLGRWESTWRKGEEPHRNTENKTGRQWDGGEINLRYKK